MRFATASLTSLAALPFALLACADADSPADAGGTPAADASTPRADATTLDADALDAESPDAIAALMDAAMGFDASVFMPDAAAGCTYPAGAVEPMALDQVLTPYRWATALDGMSADAPLDLTQAHCDLDPARSWAPFDVILFVSAPAW